MKVFLLLQQYHNYNYSTISYLEYTYLSKQNLYVDIWVSQAYKTGLGLQPPRLDKSSIFLRKFGQYTCISFFWHRLQTMRLQYTYAIILCYWHNQGRNYLCLVGGGGVFGIIVLQKSMMPAISLPCKILNCPANRSNSYSSGGNSIIVLLFI